MTRPVWLAFVLFIAACGSSSDQDVEPPTAATSPPSIADETPNTEPGELSPTTIAVTTTTESSAEITTTTESSDEFTTTTESRVTADDIPVAHTPPGGYGDTMPPPILADCSEPLGDDAVDMRGLWQIVGPADGEGDVPIGAVQRIEQCGNRMVITSGGVVHDMRVDGTLDNGVNDVAAFDFTTPVRVAAFWEDGVHVLRPDGVPIEVTRQLDGNQLIWRYINFAARLERIDSP